MIYNCSQTCYAETGLHACKAAVQEAKAQLVANRAEARQTRAAWDSCTTARKKYGFTNHETCLEHPEDLSHNDAVGHLNPQTQSPKPRS